MSGTPELVATPSQTVGPFFSFGLTTNAALAPLDQMGRAAAPGEEIRLVFRVLDRDGAPVPDAMIEAWHPDSSGTYLFGRAGADATGVYTLSTVQPSAPPGSRGEAAHVNLCVFMRGLLRHVYTRMYFAGDPALTDDPLLLQVPAERRQTLVAQPTGTPGTWGLDLRLQGEGETVFFDL